LEHLLSPEKHATTKFLGRLQDFAAKPPAWSPGLSRLVALVSDRHATQQLSEKNAGAALFMSSRLMT